MNKVLALGWMLSVACGGASAPSPEPGAVAAPVGKKTDLSIDEFISRHGTGIQVVDVRTDGEYQAGHIPGVVHVPLADLSPDHPAIQKLDKSKPVYFVCAVGGRSARAADQMAAAGVDAINVLGGTNAWVDKGQPLQKP